jgi:hypothetical protein
LQTLDTPALLMLMKPKILFSTMLTGTMQTSGIHRYRHFLTVEMACCSLEEGWIA